MFETNSLRFKTSAFALFVLAVILIIYGGFLFLTFHGALYQELDEELKGKARQIDGALDSYLRVVGSDEKSFQFSVNRVITQTGEHPHMNKIEKIERLWVDQMWALGLSRDYLGFVLEDGRTLAARSPGRNPAVLPLRYRTIQAALKGRPFFQNVSFGKERLRVIIMPAFYKKNRGVIVVGTPLEKISHILGTTLTRQVILMAFILGIALLLSRIFAQRVLRPVEEIVHTVRNINYRDLGVRIRTENVDMEMKILVDTLNEMMLRLETSFRYIADFSSHVSHELKTPLAVIRGESELALRREHPAEEYRKVIRDNLDEVIRMDKIVDDLLLLARLDYEPHVFLRESFDALEFFREIEESGRILAGQKDLELRADLSRAPRRIQGDKVHLRRLFFNLINNAIKFTPRGGKIDIAVKQNGRNTFVSVSDTGIGIPEENLPNIFKKFFHYEDTRENIPAGNGLGLSLAQSIARVHGGDIRVKSVAKQGSTFIVRLPFNE